MAKDHSMSILLGRLGKPPNAARALGDSEITAILILRKECYPFVWQLTLFVLGALGASAWVSML